MKKFRSRVKIVFEGEVFGSAEHKAEFISAIKDGFFRATLDSIQNVSEEIEEWDFPTTQTSIEISHVKLDKRSEYDID